MKKLLVIAVTVLLLMTPAAMADGLNSWDEVEQVFALSFEKGETQTAFLLNKTLLEEMETDHSGLCSAAARAGFRKISWKYRSSGQVEITSMERYECPFIAVRTREELTLAVSAMRERTSHEVMRG